MFKWLRCKHEYKFYNTKVEYPIGSMYGRNVFQFVCPKCGSTTNVSETEIRDMIDSLKEDYNKSLVLGGKPVDPSEITIKRHHNIDVLYRSPAVTLMMEHYRRRGIDLSQIDQQNKQRGYCYSYAMGEYK